MTIISNYTAPTRQDIVQAYKEEIENLPTYRRKLNALERSLKEIQDLLGIIRPLLKEPLSCRYHLGEYITRGTVYSAQLEEGILRELIEKLRYDGTF